MVAYRAPVDVRAGTADDLQALNELYNHYVTTSYATFDVTPATLEARREWFAHYDVTGRYRFLVAVDGDRLLGYATSSQFLPREAYETSVATTVYVAPDAGGRGIGSALYDALFRALEGEDLHRAYAGIALPNEASVRLHERFGFRLAGTYTEQGRKFDRYWDVAWYEKPL